MMQSTTDTEVILHLVAQSQPQPLRRPLHRCAAPARGRLFVGRADQQEAGRRARSARHPAAGDRRPRRPPDPRLGDLRARHHRRQIRARRRERRNRGVRRGRRAFAQAVPADAGAALHLRIHLFRAAGFDRRRPLASTTCARPWARSWRAKRRPPPTWSCRCRIPACRPRMGYCAGVRHSLRAGHHPQPLCRPHLHRADAADPPARRAPEARANRAVVNGKRIVLVDDSIVRGTTSIKIVQMMRDAGASEVHIRIASPPITHPDYYGIDTPERDKLLAATHDLEGMRAVHRRRFAGLPVGRGHLPRHGLRSGAIRCARNSPTIASPANIRPR